jgi:hypothetical protein
MVYKNQPKAHKPFKYRANMVETRFAPPGKNTAYASTRAAGLADRTCLARAIVAGHFCGKGEHSFALADIEERQCGRHRKNR